MKKSAWLIIILILLCFLIGGFFIYKNFDKIQFFGIRTQADLSAMKQEFKECKNFDYNSKASGENSFAPQPNYSEINYIALMSLLEKDKKFCEAIAGKTQQEQCLDLFFGYAYVVFGDKEYLDQISSPALKSFGEAIKTGSPSLCPQADGRNIETCKAAAAGDTQICAQSNKTNDKGLLKECESNVYLAVALRDKKLELCQKIDRNSHLTGEIQYLVCVAALGDEEDAKQEFSNSYRDKLCSHKYVLTIAQLEKSSSLCELIPWKETYNKANYEECIKFPQK